MHFLPEIYSKKDVLETKNFSRQSVKAVVIPLVVPRCHAKQLTLVQKNCLLALKYDQYWTRNAWSTFSEITEADLRFCGREGVTKPVGVPGF